MKQLAIASPMVITTEYRPLQDVFFDIVGNDEPLEQWYYQNSGIYKPDRRIENLILTPEITVTVPEWERSSSVVITENHWYYNTGGGWIEVFETSDGIGVEFYRNDSTKSLIVKKNVLPDTPVRIRGTFFFSDPRNGNIIYKVEKELTLTSSRDSDPIFPTLDLSVPSIRLYNPITDDEDCLFHFTATAKWGDNDISSIVQFNWSVIDLIEDPLTEIPALNHPAFSEAPDSMILPPASGGSEDTENPTVIHNKVKGQYANVCKETILMNAKYGEYLSVICRAKLIYTPVTEPPLGSNPVLLGWYERTVTEVTPTSSSNPKTSGWYEEWYGLYIPSQDEAPIATKTYYDIVYALSADTSVNASKLYFTTNGEFFPDKKVATVLWEESKIDAEAYCGGGNAIQDNDVSKTFNVICNIRGGSLTDEQKSKHLMFEWKKRLTNSSAEMSVGWGKNIVLDKALLTGTSSVNVQIRPYLYLKGALRPVTYDGETVTYDGETVYSQT